MTMNKRKDCTSNPIKVTVRRKMRKSRMAWLQMTKAATAVTKQLMLGNM